LLEVNRQLSAKGLYIKAGEVSIVDATVTCAPEGIEAKQSRPRKGKGGENTQDREAGYNVKVAVGGKKTSTYGYKAHVNVDEDGFIKAVEYTPGNEHDKLLAKRNTGNRILHKAKRNQPLSDRKKHQNRQWSSVRCTVERVFGVLKQHYGIGKARYLGLKRNQTRFMLAAMAYNIKRGVAVQAEMMACAG
jgi:transposase, IS5 family